MTEISVDKAFTRMARICSGREYCRLDITKKLERYNLEHSQINDVITRLEEENFLNENRYVRSFVNDKTNFGKWGRKKIEFALKQKSISKDIINEVFAEMPQPSMEELLLPLLMKKYKSVKGNTEFDKRGKLIRFALGRGFTMDETLRCVEKIFDNNKSDEIYNS